MKNNSITFTEQNISEAHVALKSRGASRIYYRDTVHSLPHTKDKSLQYSRAEARSIFEQKPEIVLVEYVSSGCKTDSQLVGTRGCSHAPKGCYVVISSTGGMWGKSRRDFMPH